MTEAKGWKVRADDLRQIAAKTSEPERERKMLALAEQSDRCSSRGRSLYPNRPREP
jgi:hypothetical protein